jgi:O-antigen/teichoic acid export membrane protein
VLNLYKCCSEKHFTKLVYINNGKFRNDGLAQVSEQINIGKTAAYFWRKTFGYKFYKVVRLYFILLWVKIKDKKYDHVIAIDSSGYLPARLLFRSTVYFSLETEKDVYYDLDRMLGIDALIIQSSERKEYMIGNDPAIKVFYIQNAPILDGKFHPQEQKKEKRILYMGNIEFGYGLEQFIEAVLSLSNEYSLTLKGIKNERYFNFLNEKYKDQIEKHRLVFDFDYVPQERVIEYVSQYYIGITGYDLELAKQSFNYYSSPAGKLFNYYAAGIPVIGIDIVGLKSVKDFNAGALIEEVTPQKIKAAIENVESDYAAISANSLKAAEHFDFRKSFNTFMSAIDSDSPKKKFSLKNFVSSGHERSIKTKRNILSAMLIKCFSIVISFLLIPLALNYLNPVKYGIWLTLTSVIGWFTFFDLGLGNGLRNRLAEALAKNDRQLARTYISTSYAVLSIIIGAVYLIFLFVRPYLDWSRLLNTPPEMDTEISRLIMVVFSFFSLQFIIKHISMILKADQRSAFSAGINTFASLLSLIIVFILTKTTESSLFWLSVGVSVANILSPLIATVYFFSNDYSDLVPSLAFVKFKYAKDLAGLGFMFFVMQFASLILFSTDSLIISQLYGPQEVTPYNIAYKYFSIITMLFTIITTPFWSAYTDAYHKNDFEWIKRITRKLSRFWFLLLAMALFMLLFSGIFYRLWIGERVHVPFLLSLCMALWVLISAWTTIYGNFLSGVGKIRLSLYHSIVMIFLNIPLSVFLARYLNLGSAGVILGTCLCVLPQVFLHPLQFKRIVERTDTGIWGK